MSVLEELERMSEERFLAIYDALAHQGFGPLDGDVAKALRFRPKAIRKLAMEKRARHARRQLLAGRKAETIYELFGSYLVKESKELMTSFLDATGVEHEDGMIQDVEKGRPDTAKIVDAIRDLDGRFPPEDVTLYLALAAEHWPDVPEMRQAWGAR